MLPIRFERLDRRLLFCSLHTPFDAQTQARITAEALAVPESFSVDARTLVPSARESDTRGARESGSQGAWTNPFNLGLVAVHSTLLPNGKVIYWDYTGVRIFDPATSEVTTNAGPGYVLYCSGHSQLGDGRLFVTGGQAGDGDGLIDASIYDWKTDTWTPVPDMNLPRWYPTNTTLPNGDVLTISGSYYENGPPIRVVNELPQVYSVSTNTWRDLTAAELLMPLYPNFFVTPDGRTFDAGPESWGRYLNTDGLGAWQGVAGTHFGNRDYGTAVMYEPGKIMVTGGDNASTPTTGMTETLDLTTGEAWPSYQLNESMESARKHLNATILPDGTVLATGGTSSWGENDSRGRVLTSELWDPSTGEWTTLASSQVTRIYHSTALLLPDGRVMSMGGGRPSDLAHGDPDHLDAEIFSPPYLFKGPRPTITAAPESIDYREAFTIQTPDAADIAQITLVRLGSTTHTVNMDQRFNRLTFERVGDHLVATAPRSATYATPGYYMLSVLNADGVPSVSKIVHLFDQTAPGVTASSFAFETGPQAIQVTFNEDVSHTLSFADFELRNTTTNAIVPASSLSLVYDRATDTATIRPKVGNTFADGRYDLTIKSSVRDWSDQPMASDVHLTFHVLAGDIDRDGSVGFSDLLVLAQNFGKTGQTFSRGNIDYSSDGLVNFDDLLLLAQRYGTSLPVSSPGVRATRRLIHELGAL